jgi:flagellar M-ring protein FliF
LKLRMAMAGDGLPNGGSVGYEIFDKGEALGTTNFMQNVNLVRALEGELARTIRALSEVQEARVHIVLPRRELFSRQQQPPSASVLVKTRGAAKLGKQQVLAIRQLVSAAVPGLKPSHISVVDSRGRVLARAGGDGENGTLAAADNEEMERTEEAHLVRVIEELVEQSVGFGKVRAQVTADMNFDRITTNSETYNPDGQVVRSTQSVDEASASTDSNGGKSVTVANNVPDANQNQNGDSTKSANQSKRTEETVNYEISKTVQSHVREVGSIRRLSIAVLVDGSYSTGKDGKPVYTPRPQAELDKITKLVKSAVGFDAKRGDSIDVTSMRFASIDDRNLASVEPLFGLTKADYFRIAEIFVLAAVGILVILLVVRPLVSRTIEALPSALAAAAEQNLLANQSVDAPALTGPSDTGVNPQAIEDEDHEDLIDVARIEGKVRKSTLKKIEEIVERHPDETIGIIRQWMSETT